MLETFLAGLKHKPFRWLFFISIFGFFTSAILGNCPYSSFIGFFSAGSLLISFGLITIKGALERKPFGYKFFIFSSIVWFFIGSYFIYLGIT
jgi:hypothetical protein